jgi:hypothetical protein
MQMHRLTEIDMLVSKKVDGIVIAGCGKRQL